MVNMWLVGGAVRDELMGLKSKDLDYAVEAPSFGAMRDHVLSLGGEVFLEKPEYLTIRAKVPSLGAADFVLCRKDGSYYDGRHPDSVEPGTILDDLSRRDFTVNAIARNVETGEYFDPFGGRADLELRFLAAVGDARQRFLEDRLRVLRAIRFHLTKDLMLSSAILRAMRDPEIADLKGVSSERVREEVDKCCRAGSERFFEFIYSSDNSVYRLRWAIFKAIGFKPTLENEYMP